MNHEAVQEWLRVRGRLLEFENALAVLSLGVAAGEGSEESLQQERQRLEIARERCTAAYQRAFPRRLGRAVR